ncbi:MAG TPA: hypothetical protein VFL41_02905 [Gaiellaceae bacterium]|nr:hypothetical protein [Gaiellaceae bacterium]
MYRGVAAIFALLIVTGLGGQERDYAGVDRAEAERVAIRVARAMREPVFFADFRERRPRVLIGTFSSRNSRGDEAWLVIFRLPGDVNDPDQACVWVWRAVGSPDPYGIEDTASVAYGASSDPVHERCVREVFSRGIADPEQTAGVDMPEPVVSRPVPVTPFGARPSALYPRDLDPEGSAVSLTGLGIELPAGSSPGTCGFAGFVLDEASEHVVPRAIIAVSPSRPWSGISAGSPGLAERAVADELGGFLLLDFPFEPLGYDVTIDATGFATSRIVHQGCYEGSYAVGDWFVARSPRFEDATPVPVRR